MVIVEVDLDIIEDIFSKTDEINIGFDFFDRSFFQITDKKSIAYAVLYGLYDENNSMELARFFVPPVYRNTDFSVNAARCLINYCLKNKTELLIDPVDKSANFWGKVYDSFNGNIDYQEVSNPKGFWKKKQ
jgi:hypothetical protein